MATIAIIRNNFIVYDTGLVRIIRSLIRRYPTVVFGWNRENKKNYDKDILKKQVVGDKNDKNKNFDLKILDLGAPVRKTRLRAYLPMLIFFPIFWTWIFANLVAHRPKIVFACDLDTVLPCYLYKKIFRRKLAFYIFDRYALTYIPKNYAILFNTINTLEEYFSKNSDLLITVAESVLETFHKKPNHCIIIPNYPEQVVPYVDKDYKQGKALTIVYGGHIMRGRGLERIVSAIRGVQNVELCMYGLLIDRKLLEELISTPNVKYKGYLPRTDDYYKSIMKADLMVAVYDLDNPSNSVTVHNKTFESMMCGIPIITNLSPELVEQEGSGATIEYDNIEQIRTAIIQFRDNPELRKAMGNKGRMAFLKKYNWSIAEKNLHRACEILDEAHTSHH